MSAIPTSIPTIREFKPIPGQLRVIRDVRKNFDYSKGVHEIFLSGSVGSSKTLALAHLGITHCMANPGAHLGIGRLSMPALKGTLLETIRSHLGNDCSYRLKEQPGLIYLPNKSIIRSFSWQDRKYKKFRSYEFTSFLIEELTENDDLEFYHEIVMRVGRQKHVLEKFVASATNPDEPTHPAYSYFIDSKDPRRHVYYSKTEENPHLPLSYIEDLKKNLDPKMARRMLHGEWISISQESIYHAYSEKNNEAGEFKPVPGYPIYWSFDFNIGEGKPMSSVFFQFIRDKFYFFSEIVIEGARTRDVCDEADAKGLIRLGPEEYKFHWIIAGDATGKARDTRSIKSDYEIIEKFIANHPNVGSYEVLVPTINPPIRTRHNLVNAYLVNALGQVRIKIYDRCKTVREGLRLTKLKKGGDYVEDDSKREQHITTAVGYGINCAVNLTSREVPMVVAR